VRRKQKRRRDAMSKTTPKIIRELHTLDLTPSPEEQAHIRELFEWQRRSAECNYVIGGPDCSCCRHLYADKRKGGKR
jgi:hypothetical protein